MKWPGFRYARARTLEEVWALQDASGEDAKILAGGQSLLATLAFRLSDPGELIDISGIAALKGIERRDDRLRIGALTTHTELGRHPLVAQAAPLLGEAVPLIAHAAIRNRGTLGGNLAYADPASELPACLIALDADVIAVSRRGERRIPARDFFTGLFETALEPGELIGAVELAPSRAGERSVIREVTRRAGDYAMIGLAAWTDGTTSRLVFFGAGETAVFARRASAALPEIGAAQAALSADLSPAGDQHASAAMKLHLARVLIGRVAPLLFPERAAA